MDIEHLHETIIFVTVCCEPFVALKLLQKSFLMQNMLFDGSYVSDGG